MHVWIPMVIMAMVYLSGVQALTVPARSNVTTTDETLAVVVTEQDEWQEYNALAYADYLSEFDALFNGYETKWSKNGRLMLRNGDSGPYKFVAKGSK